MSILSHANLPVRQDMSCQSLLNCTYFIQRETLGFLQMQGNHELNEAVFAKHEFLVVYRSHCSVELKPNQYGELSFSSMLLEREVTNTHPEEISGLQLVG